MKRNRKVTTKGISGTLSQQELAYAYIEGKHAGLDNDWGCRLAVGQLYRNNFEQMMTFFRGYADHER